MAGYLSSADSTFKHMGNGLSSLRTDLWQGSQEIVDSPHNSHKRSHVKGLCKGISSSVGLRQDVIVI